MFSVVFLHPYNDELAIKIGCSVEGTDGWIDYASVCMDLKDDPHLLGVYSLDVFDRFYISITERLEHNIDAIQEIYDVDYDEAENLRMDINSALLYASDGLTFSPYDWDCEIAEDLADINYTFFDVFDKVFSFSSFLGNPDIHEGNWMYRDDTIVLVDPFAFGYTTAQAIDAVSRHKEFNWRVGDYYGRDAGEVVEDCQDSAHRGKDESTLLRKGQEQNNREEQQSVLDKVLSLSTRPSVPKVQLLESKRVENTAEGFRTIHEWSNWFASRLFDSYTKGRSCLALFGVDLRRYPEQLRDWMVGFTAACDHSRKVTWKVNRCSSAFFEQEAQAKVHYPTRACRNLIRVDVQYDRGDTVFTAYFNNGGRYSVSYKNWPFW